MLTCDRERQGERRVVGIVNRRGRSLRYFAVDRNHAVRGTLDSIRGGNLPGGGYGPGHRGSGASRGFAGIESVSCNMRFDVITIFPEYFAGLLSHGIVRRAREAGILDVRMTDPRDFPNDRHRTVDDRPFAGGP